MTSQLLPNGSSSIPNLTAGASNSDDTRTRVTVIFSWMSWVVIVQIVVVAGVFVAEDVVGAVALDFVDLLRAARGPRAVVEALGVVVGGGG